MRRHAVMLVGAAALAAACHDAPLQPRASLAAGAGGALAVSLTAGGFREHRIEYDWTVKKEVFRIWSHDMVKPETTVVTRIDIGDTKWIEYYIHPQRALAEETHAAGARGDACVANGGSAATQDLAVEVRLFSRTDGAAFAPVPGVAQTVTPAALAPGEERCMPYQLTFEPQEGVEYEVRVDAAASVAEVSRQAAEVAGVTLPADEATVEIDADSYVRDEVFQACDRTLGEGFLCKSVFSLPYTWHFTDTSDGRWTQFPKGLYETMYVLDISNRTACGQTFVYHNTAVLTEGGPNPPGGERRESSADLTINTSACPTPAGCVKPIDWWNNHSGHGPDHPEDAVSMYLTITLGTPRGPTAVEIWTPAQAWQVMILSGDANGISSLLGRLLVAKLNIARGGDPTVVSSTVAQADVFLATHDASMWASLSAQERAQVLAWSKTLFEYDEGVIGPGLCK